MEVNTKRNDRVARSLFCPEKPAFDSILSVFFQTQSISELVLADAAN